LNNLIAPLLEKDEEKMEELFFIPSPGFEKQTYKTTSKHVTN
jgi:hypothetical protein